MSRPLGSRKPSPERRLAMQIYTAWRAVGHEGIITRNEAIELTFNTIKVEKETISLAALALKYAIYQIKESRR